MAPLLRLKAAVTSSLLLFVPTLLLLSSPSSRPRGGGLRYLGGRRGRPYSSTSSSMGESLGLSGFIDRSLARAARRVVVPNHSVQFTPAALACLLRRSTEELGLPLFAHLRVVVRTHPPELLQLRSLIYGMRAAAESRHWLRLDFVLVPTEPGSGVTYDRLQRGRWR